MKSNVAPALVLGVCLLASPSAQRPDFSGAPEVDHPGLFKLFMAANADVLAANRPAAWEHHLLFTVAAGTLPQNPISKECLALNDQLRNEITRQALGERAIADFKKALAEAQTWPKTILVRLKTRESIGEYDLVAGAFPVVPIGPLTVADARLRVVRDGTERGIGGPVFGAVRGSCRTSTRVFPDADPVPAHFELEMTGNERLRRVPMDREAAAAFISANRDRGVEFEVLIDAGPAALRPSGPSSALVIPVPARIVAARALDPATGRVLHDYGSAPASTTATTPAPAADTERRDAGAPRVPLTSYRAMLLMVRDLPQIANVAALLRPAQMQIMAEQRAWAVLDEAGSPSRERALRLNPKRSRFTYEWQTELERNPTLARGELLDVFLRSDADWSFVTREREWDPRFNALVDAFLFSRGKVEGREPAFAAQELVTTYKQHLEAGAAKAPTALSLALPLPGYTYDFTTKSMRFGGAGGAELLQAADAPGAPWAIPPGARGSATYGLFGAVPFMSRADPAVKKPGVELGEPPSQTWRGSFSIGGSGSGEGENLPQVEVLALDRQLRIASVPVDPGTAEKLAKESSYSSMGTMKGLTARVLFEAQKVELSERTIERRRAKFGVLYGRVSGIEIVSADGRVIASLAPSDLAAPSARATDAPSAQPPRPATPAPGQERNVQDAYREVEERNKAMSAGAEQRALETKRMVMCSMKAAGAAPEVPEQAREKDPRYQKVFKACMAEK
jgi:hypothetical protein